MVSAALPDLVSTFQRLLDSSQRRAAARPRLDDARLHKLALRSDVCLLVGFIKKTHTEFYSPQCEALTALDESKVSKHRCSLKSNWMISESCRRFK